MHEPFQFYNCYIQTEYAGVKASDINDFLEELKFIQPDSIFYHITRPLLAHDFLQSAYWNDFSVWIWQRYGSQILAEEINSIEYTSLETIEDIRSTIVDLIQNYISDIQKVDHQEKFYFYFCRPRVFINKLDHVIYTLDDFKHKIKSIPESSMYYHLLITRWLFSAVDKQDSDFSSWIRNSLNNPDLADLINNINPYLSDIEDYKQKLFTVITEYEGE